jgi:hypothetical protein
VIARRIVPLLLIVAIAATPSTASADHELDAAVVLIAADVVVGVASLVTFVGNAIQLKNDAPRVGWSIAGFVAGGIATGIGGGVLLIGLAAGAGDEGLLWTFTLPPLISGLASLALSIATTVKRRNQAKPSDQEEEYEEYEEEEGEWTFAPIWLKTRDGESAPGLGAAIAF